MYYRMVKPLHITLHKVAHNLCTPNIIIVGKDEAGHSMTIWSCSPPHILVHYDFMIITRRLCHRMVSRKWHNPPHQSLMHCLACHIGLTCHLTQHYGQGFNHSLAQFARKKLRSQNVLHSWSSLHSQRNTLCPPPYSNHNTFPISLLP